MPRITINGKACQAVAGQTILQAAKEAGVTIPTLCYHPDLSVVATCRLCLVEVEGHDGLVPACHEVATAGCVIHTDSPRVIRERRQVLRFLLENYVGDMSQPSEFAHWVKHYQVEPPPLPSPRFSFDADPHPLLRADWNQCILCTRCIRACNEVQGRFVWHLAERGEHMHLVAGTGTTMQEAGCESCGACAAYCPTGALQDRVQINAPASDREVTTTCPYCGVGCQFKLQVADDRVTHVTSDPQAPVNGMALCVKGRYGHRFIHHPDRLQKARVRSYLREGRSHLNRPNDRGPWVEVGLEEALSVVAKKLAAIYRESGGKALGLFASAKCTNEENYLLQKLMRQVLRSHNVDHCARLCHASTVTGLSMALGTGAMSNTMHDIAQQAQALFLIGSNVTEQHPVFGSMLRQAVLQRGVPLIVADPRSIEITEFATLHLRQRPGTDVSLLCGIMREIVRQDGQATDFIRQHCEGYEEFRESLEQYTLAHVAQITGVDEAAIQEAATILCRHRPAAVIWAMGITQHTTGVINVLSLANLQLLLGNLGMPGGGVNPLRGQNNVQGACDMGALPNVFPGYQSVTQTQISEKFAAAWQLASSSGSLGRPLPLTPGLTLTEMITAAQHGKVRGLFICGENPIATDPNSNHVREALASTEFVVLQEIFASETADYADVLLPGASFAEKDGTFTNTERRVQRVRQAVPSPGDAQADWKIITRLALHLLQELGQKPVGPFAGWGYSHPEEIQQEIAALTPSYAGVTYARLDRGESLQWPVLDENHPGTPILHVGGIVGGKGKFHAIDHLPPEELPDAEFPWILTTGRVLYHWHAGEMTRRVPELLSIVPRPIIEIHPDDAQRLNLQEGAAIKVISRRGETLGHAHLTDRVMPGVIFGNFHFPAEQNINNVTIDVTDPTAKIPEYKVCAVRVERVKKIT